MLKHHIKKFFKSKLGENFLSKFIVYYLKFVRFTSKLTIEYGEGFDKEKFKAANNHIFAVWHQELALAVFMFEDIKSRTRALVSPHSDGKILANIINDFGYKTISGSTNESATKALREIISILKDGENLVITPDGPKGPAKEINSNILAVAAKTSSFLVPMTISSRYIELRSWDRFHFPLPFSNIKVKFGKHIMPAGNKKSDDEFLKLSLDQLQEDARKEIPVSKFSDRNFEYFLSLVSILSFPVLVVLLLVRLFKGKESSQRILERIAIGSDIPSENMVWIHCASVGESILGFSLMDMLLARNKNLKFLLTTGTVTSANLARSKMKEYNVTRQVITHQFIPIDNIFFVKKFMNYWKPKLGLFIESELWPNLIFEASKHCHLILLNAKMSHRSFARWHKYKFIIEKMASKFSSVLAQREQDKIYYERLKFNNVSFAGNLKYVQKDDRIDLKLYESLLKQIGGRKVIFAASTHPGEEEIITNIYIKLKKEIKGLLLILAPRHPARTQEILEIIRKHKLSICLRTSDENISAKTDVFILNTIGELPLIFKLKPITIMGGSFTIGGHNILEPAKYESPIIFGPDMSNFSEISKEFLEKGAAIQVHNSDELERETRNLLNCSDRNLSKYTGASLDIIKSKQKILDIYLDEINRYI